MPGGGLAVGWKIRCHDHPHAAQCAGHGDRHRSAAPSRRRIVTLIVGIVILVAIASVRSAAHCRPAARLVDLGRSVVSGGVPAHPRGPNTVFPFLRTVFTLAAGLLFGWWWGALIAVAASTASAVIALALIRLTAGSCPTS